MIEWRFFLDTTEVDEPDNFADLLLMLKRDEAYHGVFFEASISSLTFSGAAAFYIMDKDDTEGLLAQIVFKAEFNCGDDWDEIIKGTLNMGKLSRKCSAACKVVIPIEQVNCAMLLKNRFDQKVDLDSLVAFNKSTGLEPYQYAGFDMNMPSKALLVGAKGFVADDGDEVDYADLPNQIFARTYVRPSYLKTIDASIVTTQLEPSVYIATNANSFGQATVSPVILLEENIDCFEGAFTYRFRFKGHLHITQVTDILQIRVIKGFLPEDEADPLGYYPTPATGLTELGVYDFAPGDGSQTIDTDFDQTFSGSTTLNQGEGIWGYIFSAQQERSDSAPSSIIFDKETEVFIEAIRECPVSDAKVYMVNEALSRVTEAITNACLKVRSDYYGRTDSQPYAAEDDGCGGLRAINNGLQLRRADVRDPLSDDFAPAQFFTSLKDLLEGLNPIDNIGFGIEPDPDRIGFDQLRIEPVNYFYREEEVLALDFANDVEENTIETDAYANVKSGYMKWEVEAVNGLDEVNANREYRTALTTVSNTLDIRSKMVAGSYATEITRQQSYAASGAADTGYDNETFIYCVKRALYGFDVEQGGITSPSGMFSPTTLYNWRIRPFYNLMRWFKSIASSYPTVGDTEKKLFFTAGTGNFRASGELTSTACKLENGPKAENQDLGVDDFATGDFQPLWRPKQIQFKYALSISDYKKIKNSPYGYISVQCGTGEWLQGFINTIQYSPTKGEAEINLRMRWQP